MYVVCILDSVAVTYDPAKARTNQRKHGVSFAHAADALLDPMALTVGDPDAVGEARFITLGMDSLGRMLVVVHTPRGEATRIISARKASPGEAEQYHA